MDKIWAPWRAKYFKIKKRKGCIFCHVRKNKDYLIFETKHCVAVLNIFPYNNGHVMVAPKAHIKDFPELKDNQILDLMKSVDKAKLLLHKVLKPQGYNIGINLSGVAGAGIPDHLHIHIVPRWPGDTNFMPVLNNTKIISQSLNELKKQLKDAQSRTN